MHKTMLLRLTVEDDAHIGPVVRLLHRARCSAFQVNTCDRFPRHLALFCLVHFADISNLTTALDGHPVKLLYLSLGRHVPELG